MITPSINYDIAIASINEFMRDEQSETLIDSFWPQFCRKVNVDSKIASKKKIWFTAVQQELSTAFTSREDVSTILEDLSRPDPLQFTKSLKKMAKIAPGTTCFDVASTLFLKKALDAQDWEIAFQMASNNSVAANDNASKLKDALVEVLHLPEITNNLRQSIKKIFKKNPVLHEATSDILFKTKENQVTYAHKALLVASKGHYFDSIFSKNWKEEAYVKSDFDQPMLQTIIDFYEKDLPLPEHALASLWDMANYYQLKELKEECEKLIVLSSKNIFEGLLAAIQAFDREFETLLIACPLLREAFPEVVEVDQETALILQHILTAYDKGIFITKGHEGLGLSISDVADEEALEAIHFYLSRYQFHTLTIKEAKSLCDIATASQKVGVKKLVIEDAALSNEWLEKNIELPKVETLVFSSSSSHFPFFDSQDFDSQEYQVRHIHIAGIDLDLTGPTFEAFCDFVKNSSWLKSLSLDVIGDFCTLAEFELLLQASLSNRSLKYLDMKFKNELFTKILKEKGLLPITSEEVHGVFSCKISTP